jgi:hypothetical protein
MKSRRRIAFTKAGTTPNRTRLQQGFTTGGMGFRGRFAWQQSPGLNVRFVISGIKDFNKLDCQKVLKARFDPQRLFSKVSNRKMKP